MGLGFDPTTFRTESTPLTTRPGLPPNAIKQLTHYSDRRKRHEKSQAGLWAHLYGK